MKHDGVDVYHCPHEDNCLFCAMDFATKQTMTCRHMVLKPTPEGAWPPTPRGVCAIPHYNRGGITLAECAKVFGCTRERMRQLEQFAKCKLRNHGKEPCRGNKREFHWCAYCLDNPERQERPPDYEAIKKRRMKAGYGGHAS